MYNSLSIAISTLVGKCNPMYGVQLMLQEFHTLPVGSKVQIQSTVGYVILWAQSQVIQSYGSALSAYGLIFLRRSLYFIQSYVLIQWSLLARINRINCLSTTKSSSSYSTSCLKHITHRVVGVAHYHSVVLQQLFFFEVRIIFG
jgi:hypothetical protein